MAGERVELPLGEVCDVKQGRYFGPGDMSKVKTEQTPIPVIGANGILGYTDQPSYKTPVTLVTCRGSNCGMLQRTAGPTWISNNAMACPPKKPHDSRYIHYVLQSTDFGEVITGSAQPQITTGHLNTKVITITRDPEEQKAIAAVLGALDDKIELNRRMNATLEAMARALFQSWFVDFDPVRAKLDGRKPVGLDETTAALFPATFQESALGEIPHGWRIGTLGELVQLRTDRVDATPAKDSTRYVALEDMPSKSIDLSSFQLGSAVNSSITAFRKGDVLFGSMRPYFHKVGLAFFDGITRTTTFVLRPRKDCFRHFALLHFFSDDVVAHSTTASVGTTIPYVRWDSMESYRIPIPPDSLLAAFEKVVGSLVQRIASQGEESRTLATLRDTLLPKLLSGELKVSKSN
jgi:type I restriction enzyme S subunit